MKFKRDAGFLRETIEDICKKRGIENYYPRFRFERMKVNGQELHLSILESENPKGVIIFTPGTNAYALLYGEYLLALADLGYKVIGCDPRCHGQSSGKSGSYTIEELVDDLYEIINFFDQKEKLPIHLSGSSQGGIASFYCASKEEKAAATEKRTPVIRSLICHNIADLSANDAVELTRHPGLSRLLKPVAPAFSALFPELPVSMAFYLNLKIEPVRNMGNAWNILQQDPLLPDLVRLKTLVSLGSARLPVAVEKMTTPLFLIQAGKDTIFKTAYSQRLFDRLTCKKQMALYPELHHYMIVDNVHEFIGDVGKWLKSFEG